jgi:phosphohistidine phosphatase SixA
MKTLLRRGGTRNLGGMIAHALLIKGASLRMLVQSVGRSEEPPGLAAEAIMVEEVSEDFKPIDTFLSQTWQHQGGVDGVSQSPERPVMRFAHSAGLGVFARVARTLAMIAFAAGIIGVTVSSGSAAADGWSTMSDNAVVLFRHATAPGVGDPPGFRLDDCATQRNLDEAGSKQARRIGQAFRDRGIQVGAVVSSQWCRARDTAMLAFGGSPREVPVFNSFFNTLEQREAQTAAARLFLGQWQGPGVLVVITHQVNISALTGIYPASGEGIVLRVQDSGLQVLGRIQP